MVLIDNFNLNCYCAKKWKDVAGEGPIYIESKYYNPYKEWRSPIIFISNSEPPFPEIDLRNRILKGESNMVIVKAKNTEGMFFKN